MLRYSYNRFLAVSARAIRRSLKEDKRIVAERRATSELRFATWKVCELGALITAGTGLLMPQ